MGVSIRQNVGVNTIAQIPKEIATTPNLVHWPLFPMYIGYPVSRGGGDVCNSIKTSWKLEKLNSSGRLHLKNQLADKLLEVI